MLAGCGTEVGLRDAAELPTPTFVAPPADPADSVMLAAVPVRDTGGLDPANPSSDAALIKGAVALAGAHEPPFTHFSRVSANATDAYLSVQDPTNESLSSTVLFSSTDEYVSDPTFSDAPVITLDGVDLDVPVAVVAAVETTIPSVNVTWVDLRIGDDEMGLVWQLTLEDARGIVAWVLADLDGSIVAVDPW